MQTFAAPLTQVEAAHWSPVVQAFPSSHESVFGVKVQARSTQASSVQGFPSSHAAAVSQLLHPSMPTCWQPEAGRQESAVQASLSSQSRDPPAVQLPPAQTSGSVQASPSLHEAVLFVRTQPAVTLHESSVHGFPSLQLGGGPPTQAPAAHRSAVVHSLRSSQGKVLFVCTQPVAALHVSVVQGFGSSQSSGGPPTQSPLLHRSAVVHASLSEHGSVLFVRTQPLAGLQLSEVQGFVSAHSSGGPPLHVPPWHASSVVQASPSLQVVPFGRVGFVQIPVAGLHVPGWWHWSGVGQTTGFDPVHEPA